MYNYTIGKLKKKHKILEEGRGGLQYTIIDAPLQILNFAYPHPDFIYGEKNNVKYNELYGKEGLGRIIDSKKKKNYKNKPEILKKYGRIFSPSEINKYSGKIG